MSQSKSVLSHSKLSLVYSLINILASHSLLSGSADGSIHIHDVFNYSGSLQCTCKSICKIDRQSPHCHKYSVECVQWYPFDSGMFLSSGMDRCLKVWNANELAAVDCFIFEGKIYQHNMSPTATQHNLVAGLKITTYY